MSGLHEVDDAPWTELLSRYETTATRLESAYAELRSHAVRIEGELADKNRLLAASVEEMDRVLEALPLAVFRQRGAVISPINAAARIVLATHGRVPALHGGPESVVTEIGVDGKSRCFEGRTVPTDDGALVFLEDRTRQIAMESELRRLERLGGLAELALGIAHEIRNPLNGLAGFASLLHRTPESPRVSEWAGKIAEGSRRVESIVRDLLDFARPERAAETVALQIAEWFEVAARELPVDIDAETGLVRVVGSRGPLEQVLSNLTRNSKEAGATRCRVCKLVHGAESVGAESVTIRISDDGPGIDPTVAGRIFDPFVGTKERGSGLGLAFAARAIERMGGALRLASEQGAADLPGAAFELTLRLAHDARTENGA
ncbi:MAG: hypothetical protein H6832_18880 [Planctomycetes bacterium]|nr:hypothetical protein [Planctomycetota bacterium]MCB9920475.1 hypothetical protein [Planctomycetota bacterium]